MGGGMYRTSHSHNDFFSASVSIKNFRFDVFSVVIFSSQIKE